MSYKNSDKYKIVEESQSNLENLKDLQTKLPINGDTDNLTNEDEDKVEGEYNTGLGVDNPNDTVLDKNVNVKK